MINIFEWVLKTPRLTAREKVVLLHESEICSGIAKLGRTARFEHANSGNTTRQGYMGCIVKLANSIKKQADSDDFYKQENADEVFNSDWKAFMDGEVTSSNKADKTTLGGASKFQGEDSAEDEPAQFDDNMDAIMGRFNSFNSLMGSSSNSSAIEDDKDNEEELAPVIVTEFEEEKVYTTSNIEVELPKPEDERCDENFYDNAYWGSSDHVNDDELEEMLADYE